MPNDNDFLPQNHFLEVMSTQNNRKLVNEVLEIMWLSNFLINADIRSEHVEAEV
jgi:hypothetical protein